MADNENNLQHVSKINHDKIMDALSNAGRRNALALDLGISDGDLSKLVNGSMPKFCQLLAMVGLEIHKVDYVKSLRKILKEEL